MVSSVVKSVSAAGQQDGGVVIPQREAPAARVAVWVDARCLLASS